MDVTALDVGAEVRKMRRQTCACHNLPCEVDTVVVDYLELAKPNRLPGREMRFAYKAIGEEFRKLAKNLDVPVLTAWQVNRTGYEKDLIEMTDSSESWEIVKIADQIIGVNRNSEENRNKRARLNIIKQRESTNRDLHELFCDFDRMTVRDVEVQDHRDLASRLLGDPNAQATPGH